MVSRWLPLYLVGIAALTLFPFTSPSCSTSGWIFKLGASDATANLIAFFPIGLALRRSSLARTLALAFTLSLAIEICQQWLPRQQDVTDLIANTAGAGLGWWLARLWRARWSGPLLRPVTRNLILRAAAAVFLALVAFQAATAPGHDFSSWEPYPIVIGNSAYGDRPWMGAVSELALYDRALPAGRKTKRLEPGPAPALWAEGGPILWLRFTGGEPTGRVDGPGGPIGFAPRVDDSTFVTPAGVTMAPSGVRLAPWVAEQISEHMRTRKQLTLDVRLKSDVLRQHGPARIVSMGDGAKRRNFMLGQRSASFVALLRTPANGAHGSRLDLRSANFRVTGEEQQLRVTYDGAEGTLWVDGRCEDNTAMALGTAPRLVGSLLGISLVACIALTALAAASFTRRRAAGAALAVACGVLAWSLLAALETWSYIPGLEPRALLIGIASIAGTLPIVLKPRS